jgi:Uma2 family endonuclease
MKAILPIVKNGRATYDDILALPEGVNGEIIDGELFVSPRPAPPHADACAEIMTEIGVLRGPPGGGRTGGWRILVEPELHLGEDVLVPDLAAWRLERMPKLPATAAFELVPDWICEIVSPSSGRLDRVKKMRVYARVGVANAWLVDPLQRTLELYSLEAGRWTQTSAHSDDEKVRDSPFEAVELELARWWAEVED